MAAKFYSSREVSENLGISKRTIRRAISGGELNPIRFNARVLRFAEKDVLQWVSARRLSASGHKSA